MSNWETKTVTSALTGTETAPVNQAGVSKYTTINMIKTFISTAFEAAGSIVTAINAHLAAFTHGDIAHTNRAQLDLVQGINTGDQDLSTFITPITGTFTPTESSGANLAFTGVSGWYSKIDKIVTVHLAVTYPTTTNATALARIGNLPFPANGEHWVQVSTSSFQSSMAKMFDGTNSIQFGYLNSSFSALAINATFTYKTT